MELPAGPLEGLVGWAVPAGERGVAAHLHGPLGRLIERVPRREFDDVEVLFVTVDAVRWILDAVTKQESG